MEIIQGIYGLQQAGVLANNLFAHRLGKHGYVWSSISFKLAVDNFVIGYVRREHVDHLISELKCIMKELLHIGKDWYTVE